MNLYRIFFLVLSPWVAAIAANQEVPALSGTASGQVSFSRDVAPILNKQCANCHGPKKSKGRYRLHTFDFLMTPGSSKKSPVTPTDLEKSELYHLLVTDDSDDMMPKDGERLPQAQIETIRRWIEQGAKFDGPSRSTVLSTLVSSTKHPDAPQVYSRPIPIRALAFSPNGAQLAVAGYREVTLWNASDGKLVRRIGGLPAQTLSLAYSPDGRLLAIGGGVSGELGEVRVVDPDTGEGMRLLATLDDVVLGVTFSPDGTQLAVSSADSSLRLFNVNSGQQVFRMDDHSDWVMSVAFSPDGKHLATASRDKTAKVIDLPGGEVRRTFRDHLQQVFGVAFAPDAQTVFSIGADKYVRSWKLDEPVKKESMGYVAIPDLPLRIKATDRGFLVACADHAVRLISPNGRAILSTFQAGGDWFDALDYDAHSGRVAAGSQDGTVCIWKIADGAKVLEFVAAPGWPKTRG